MKKGTWGGKRAGAGRNLKHETPTKVVALTIPVDVLEELTARAAEQGKSRSELATQYLKRALARRSQQRARSERQ